MTINLALDKIFVLYEKKNMENYPDVLCLKQQLIDYKVFWGGNKPIENEIEVMNIIKYGTSDPEFWK